MVKLNRSIFILFLVISVMGLVFLTSSSVVDAYRDFGDKWHYLKLQLRWFIIGISLFIIFSKIPLQKLEKYSSAIFIVSLFLLSLVLIPGLSPNISGAHRWLVFGSFYFQPSELIKLSLIIYLSRILTTSVKFTSFFVPVLLSVILIMLEPDLGTSLVVLFVSLSVYFLSGQNIKIFIYLIPALIITISLFIAISPYRLARIKTFIGLSQDTLGRSYQANQSQIAIGSGGLFGVGLGQSRQKYNFLPESSTDAIFSIVGEEIGLLGLSAVLFVYLLLLLNGFKISSQIDKKFLKNLSLSITSLFAIQVLLNIGAVTGLLPLTGVPLPFISYGGSAFLVFSSGAGILSNIGKLC